jgi:uncharacterized phage protein gp47/JayE
MDLPTRDFTAIVRDMSTAITTSASGLIDVSVGSILRAIIEANAAIVLWVQWLVLLTLQTTRAATSTGVDLDSWMADFSFQRLPSITASGVATFSRFSGTATALIPVGTFVKTLDGSIGFSVVMDSINPAWQASMNAYLLAIGVMSIDLPITANLPGTTGNVLANIITLLASAAPGIDSVNNQEPTTGGADAEPDTAFRNRFTNFFAARSRATLDAVGYAVSTIGQNLNYVIQENIDTSGNAKPGNMLITVDDGSGSLSGALFNSLSLAIEVVRPIGTTFSIQPPLITPVQVSLSISLPPESSIPTVQSLLQSAITQYINGRGIGSTLSVTRISQLIYQIEPLIINVSNIELNGQSADLRSLGTEAFQSAGVSFT